MTKPLHESATLAEATTTSDNAGLLEVEFITPGWGSSGYYSREVVEAAAPLFAGGTHMYFDHPSATEDSDRPERSVRDLAAVIEGDAFVSPDTGGVRGKVRPLKAYKDLLTDEAFAKNVGLSIRGSASDITVGEAEGRTGPIIEGLAHLSSVDFVTRAGRGGRVLSVLESAGVVEATANDTREQLQTLVRDAYGAEKTYVWVRDFDETTVWFEVESGDDSGVYGQSYTTADGVIALSGGRTEVRVSTTYVPVTRPDSTNPTTEADQEVTMGNIQIEESEHRSLVEKAGRVDALESERDTAIVERDTARGELAAYRRREAAAKIVGEAKVGDDKVAFTTLEARGLLSDLPVKQGSVDLDVDAFTKTVAEAAATALAERGAGSVSGFGGTSTPSTTVSESDIDSAVGSAFGRQPVKGA